MWKPHGFAQSLKPFRFTKRYGLPYLHWQAHVWLYIIWIVVVSETCDAFLFSFGLFEAMSAIEMMDPKMDAGMMCNQAKRKVLNFEKSVEVMHSAFS